MKALKASICVTALALSLSLVVPCYAGEADAAAPGVEKAGPDVLREAFASRLELQSTELYQAGKYAAALPVAQQLLALREKEFGPDHPMVAMPLNDLGTIHYNLGQYAVAEPLYKRSLAIREKTLGPEHAEVASVLNNLGDLYRATERYAEA